MKTDGVTVRNLSTGEEHDYTCPANEAVVCAFEQARKNYSTWDYDYSKAIVSKSGKTVSCGDWVALLN
jgi:hypothetical protein